MCLMLCVCLCLCLSLCVCLLAGADSPVSKPTPLYGQPSWWGEDDDPANKKVERGGKSPERESAGQRKCPILLLPCVQGLIFYKGIDTEGFVMTCAVICTVSVLDILTSVN